MQTRKLKAGFFKRPSLVVAPKLLGKILVHNTPDGVLSGIIVEVEAYGGIEDAASHASKGKTERNNVMFRAGGAFYVYFTYGSHYCCNVVTGKDGEGEAVLIRALEPLQGIDTMRVNRNLTDAANRKELLLISNGPGKLCQALGITKEQNGLSLEEDRVYITEGLRIKPENICTSERVGITKAVELPWRFYIKDNVYVSKR